jgi:DNA-binding response OmpR family regulator
VSNTDERISVLIADYDPWTRLSVSSPLGEAGFAVREASNGMSALRSAVAAPPHVVVVGPQLSEIATAEVVRSLRSDPRTRNTALILIGDEDAALEVDASIKLPCNPIELLASVMRALQEQARDASARHRIVPLRAPMSALQAEMATPIRSVLASA